MGHRKALCAAVVSLARMCSPQGENICLLCSALGSQDPVCAPYRFSVMDAAVYHKRHSEILPDFQVEISLQVSED